MPHRLVLDSFKGVGRRDLRCRGCGYGVVVRQLPSGGCPMCHETRWLEVKAAVSAGDGRRG